MSLKQALSEYESMLSAPVTADELEASLAELIENKATGRASGFYKPADDPCGDDLWP